MKRSTLDALWPWVEPVAAILIGLVFQFQLQLPDLAKITWAVGVLLTLTTISTTQRLKDRLSDLERVREIIDVSQQAKVSSVRDVLHAYLSVREPEFQAIRDDILQTCVTRLEQLAHDKKTRIEGGEYYLWLIEMLRSSRPQDRIVAVTTMVESSWVEIPAEKRFLEENLEAVRRGVRVERIFISTRARLTDRRNLDAIVQQVAGGVDAFVTWREDLEERDPRLIEELGAGLIIFGDRVALVDDAVPPQSVSGTVTMHPTGIAAYKRCFERLKLYSEPLGPERLALIAAAPSTPALTDSA